MKKLAIIGLSLMLFIGVSCSKPDERRNLVRSFDNNIIYQKYEEGITFNDLIITHPRPGLIRLYHIGNYGKLIKVENVEFEEKTK